ncbi:hypothetical protein A1O1_07501 [Capronia coronata CBS 617.96]|uniref:Filamentation protein n=1 Tax=Capronia coronata CBS 617.96 TaxID=1182541 RepID=W9XUJ2_9EURO|nr:uncharacterized protein A1O1_07501 [Capronia coronata CBS 617.96]EXJ83873.1 hypothetical protein A1O1_07501 [Capronia coronata CBS 617.96]
MTVIHAHPEKAQRYIGLLEAARVAGNWQELPELIRKVRKHAPDRKCLTEVASFELEIANRATTASRRPGTATTNSALPDSQVAALEAQLRASGQPFEEVVQGHTALLWARWLGFLPRDKSPSPLSFEPSRTAADATSVWTKICVVKSVYITGMLLEQAGGEANARQLHRTILPWLDSNRSLVVSTKQLLYWAQQLLARIALGRDPVLQRGAATASSDESLPIRLQAYRHWAVLAVKNNDISPATYGNGPGHLSKLAVWRSYYRFLSIILQQGAMGLQAVSMARPDLAVELRRVETSCENELLRHTQFPKANETNAAVEEWVEDLIRNWQALCGPDWSDTDLGEGGRNSVGRNVLDMLYRAATKTFHSTLILRRLFQVHRALTDFDLAYKALDTYIELMDRARAREAKSNDPIGARDSNEIFLTTIAEGIEGLCAFGRRSEAEKAYNLCSKLEDLMADLQSPSATPTANESEAPNGALQTNGSGPLSLSADVVDIAYRAIGIAKSQWARWTPVSEQRSELQSDAIQSFHRAVSQMLPREQQLKSLYALSRLLAETRDIDGAIAVVKTVLTSDLTRDTAAHSFRMPRQLLPFWHLLALLLTSRQDFETASQSCVAALAQFPPPDVMFGPFVGEGEKQATAAQKSGLVDDMECEELQKIIEIRITELALMELMEGPGNAVNRSNELLALYSRLFGRFGGVVGTEEKSRARTVERPKSSAGTVKSVRGSVFSRRKAGRDTERAPRANDAPSSTNEKPRPNTQPSDAPAIQITNEDEKPSPHKHKIFRLSLDHATKEKPRRRVSLSQSRGRKDGSDTNGTRKSVEASHETTDMARSEEKPIDSQKVPAVPVSANHDNIQEAKQPLKEIAHNLGAHDELPRPARHESQPPEQDVRLPLAGSRTTRTDLTCRFPTSASQRYALTMLVKIWLVIATLYRRASIFDDSREACDEAAKVAVKIEGMIASVESSARAFSDAGWGGCGKSSDEIWADVYYERAELSMAIARAREEKEGQGYSEGVREAVDQYEQCLMYVANHAGGIVGLSNVLLDYYERKVELAQRVDGGQGQADEAPEERSRRHRRELSRNSEGGLVDGPPGPGSSTAKEAASTTANAASGAKDDELKKTPDNLNRLAARDRAYGLLSTLTKLGSGWDNPEAWFALARAHELGGEIDRAKEILWWCVELEDTRPIRHWSNVGCGGYVL